MSSPCECSQFPITHDYELIAGIAVFFEFFLLPISRVARFLGVTDLELGNMALAAAARSIYLLADARSSSTAITRRKIRFILITLRPDSRLMMCAVTLAAVQNGDAACGKAWNGIASRCCSSPAIEEAA